MHPRPVPESPPHTAPTEGVLQIEGEVPPGHRSATTPAIVTRYSRTAKAKAMTLSG